MGLVIVQKRNKEEMKNVLQWYSFILLGVPGGGKGEILVNSFLPTAIGKQFQEESLCQILKMDQQLLKLGYYFLGQNCSYNVCEFP